MSWAAVGVGGATLVSGLMGSSAAKHAAAEQAATSRAAIAEQQRQYNQTRADQQPWRQAGAAALTDLSNKDNFKNFSMNDFQQDPGYQFRQDEAQKALQRSALARGGMMGGGFAKALDARTQDLASQEYGNAFNRFNANRDSLQNRLSGLAGIGQNANSQVAQAGQNAANNTSELLTGIGNAQAGATMGAANTWGNAIGQGMNTWMQYSAMNKPQTQAIPTGAPSAGGSMKNYFNVA
jgi:hypothetical protein